MDEMKDRVHFCWRTSSGSLMLGKQRTGSRARGAALFLNVAWLGAYKKEHPLEAAEKDWTFRRTPRHVRNSKLCPVNWRSRMRVVLSCIAQTSLASRRMITTSYNSKKRVRDLRRTTCKKHPDI